MEEETCQAQLRSRHYWKDGDGFERDEEESVIERQGLQVRRKIRKMVQGEIQLRLVHSATQNPAIRVRPAPNLHPSGR